jgi:hypothetical protein
MVHVIKLNQFSLRVEKREKERNGEIENSQHLRVPRKNADHPRKGQGLSEA